jgi:hypothetical protein
MRSPTKPPPVPPCRGRLCVSASLRDRRLLLRSVALGFREMEAVSAGAPVALRDGRRLHFGFASTKRARSRPAWTPIALGRPSPSLPYRCPQPRVERKLPCLRPRTTATPPESRVRDLQLEKWDFEDVIAEAETLRTVVRHANARTTGLLAALNHQRRQSRAVRAAMQSLQHLRLGP